MVCTRTEDTALHQPERSWTSPIGVKLSRAATGRQGRRPERWDMHAWVPMTTPPPPAVVVIEDFQAGADVELTKELDDGLMARRLHRMQRRGGGGSGTSVFLCARVNARLPARSVWNPTTAST